MIVLPHGRRSWHAVVPGAVVFAVGARSLALGTTFTFAPRIGRVDDLYDSLGLAIAIQLWLYVIGRLWVACQFLNACVSAAVTERHPGEPAEGSPARGSDPETP
jgi:uncharacterized BrkB/YihY/UPF0761 family membrane protein